MKKSQGMDRRKFLGRAALGAAAVALGPELLAFVEQLGAAEIGGKPNILVIMSDEHNAGVLGCCGNNIIRTANLDALASRGVVFESCYCNSPLCVPSRLSFTSGKYASRVGAWNNSCRLTSDDFPSLPRILNAAGYESFLCGKMHYDVTHRYGFTEIGRDGNNLNRMDGRGSRRKADQLQPSGRPSTRFKDCVAGDTSTVIRHDRRVTTDVVDFLAKRKPADKPFFLFTGYLAPHYPLTVPQACWDAYKGKVPMPKIPEGHLDSLPLNYRHLRVAFDLVDTPPETVKLGREFYHGFVQWIDEEIGKVLDALAKSPFAQNTVVVYTSDHGENMGEHGLWWKNNMFEHASHVPLIVSYPSRWKGGRRRKGATSLVDVVQTIAEVGGAQAPKDWNGTSLTGWLDRPETKWKDLAVSEYYAHNIASGFVMVRMGKWKYVYHTAPDPDHKPERELYDLEADPGEFENLARRPEQKDRVADMHTALVREIGEDPDKTELRCRADYAKGYKGVVPANAKDEAAG